MIEIPPLRFARFLCFNVSLQPARRYRAFLRSFRLGEIRLISLVEPRLPKFHRQIPKTSSIWASAVPGNKNTKKTPVLGIVNAVSMKFIENVTAAPNCKAVVADPKSNHIFMPLTTSSNGPGIGVFSE